MNQLRYTAKVLDLLPFKQKWEICERKFININEPANYIEWSKGITFSKQIESTKKYWNIK